MLSLTNKKILITGGSGFLGSSLIKKLKKEFKKTKLIIPRSKEFNLAKENDVKKLFKKFKKIDYVIHLASSHGGLYYNIKNSGSIYYTNTILNSHLMHYAMKSKIKKFVCAGTVDSYPKNISPPWSESDFWNGFPEESSAAYAFSKKMMVIQGYAYRKQFNFKTINLLFMNLYGPKDNFNLDRSHVIPAIIKKIYSAKKKRKKYIELFGNGSQKREFLFVDDAADSLILALRKYDSHTPLNIGTGKTYSIKSVAKRLIKYIDPKIKIRWKKNIETGIKVKNFNIRRAKKMIGFNPKVSLDEGLIKTIEWYKK
jgi:GDP-L-fucose synthase